MNPLVSIIIPAYNRARLIPETLESVFRQDYPHMEVIVVDDGSTDDTCEILQKYSDRITLIRQSNQGIIAARNAGAAAARGEYLLFLDSDDLMGEGVVRSAVDLLERNPDDGVVYGRIGHFKIHKGKFIQLSLNDKPDHDGNLLPDMIRGNTLTPGQYMIRKVCWLEIGGFSSKAIYAEDWDLILRLSSKFRFRFCDRMFLNRRIHSQMVTLSSKPYDIVEMRRSVLEDIFGQEAKSLMEMYLTPAVLADWYRSFGFDYALAGDIFRAKRYLEKSLAFNFWQPKLWLWIACALMKRKKGSRQRSFYGSVAKKTRIGFYTNNPFIGGSEIYLKNLIDGLDRDRFDIFVFAPANAVLWELLSHSSGFQSVQTKPPVIDRKEDLTKGGSPGPGFLKRFYLSCVPLSVRKLLGFYKEAGRLEKIFSDYHLDVFYSNEHSPCAESTILAAKKAGVARVVSVIHSIAFEKTSDFLEDWINRVSFQKADAVIFVSDYVRRLWIDKYPVLDGKSLLVYTGVKSLDVPDLSALEREFSSIRDHVKICVPANFHPIKGHRFLIDSLSDVVRTVPNIRVLFVGDGDDRRNVEDYARQKGVAEFCLFIGYRQDIRALMAFCDLVVLTSRLEVLSLALIEAMYAGKPIVSTKVGGIPEVVQEGKTGFLVDYQDGAALSDRVIRLCVDAGLRQMLGREAFLRASSRFSEGEWLKSMQDVFVSGSTQPLVSVVIPAYNASDYVVEAIESVLSQDYPCKEVIVVDDGSKDNTWEILKSFGDKIRLIHQDNSGESVARNRALREAHGKYVMFLDADDIMADGIMHKAIAVLESRPQYRIVYGIMAEFWDDHPERLMINPKVPPRYSGNIFKDIIKGYTLGMGQCVFHRADIERFGCFSEDIHFGEDWEFVLRLTRHLDAFYLPELFFKRRNHQRMQTLSSQRPDIFDVRFQIIRRVFPDDHEEIISAYLKPPVLADWYRTFGFTYISRGQGDLAEKYVRKSLQTWPYQPGLYFWLWNRSKYPWVTALVLAFVGILPVLWLTREGIGVSPDSTAYLGAARSFAEGQGLKYFNEGRFWNFTQWPPLYPLVLSVFAKLGVPLTEAARLLNVGLMAVNIFLVVVLMHILTRSQIFAFLAGVLFLVSQDILNIHSWAWSEPMFLSCILAVFYFLTRYLSEKRMSDFVLSAVFAALAFGCRYVGVAAIVCVCLMLLMERRLSLKDRFQKTALFGAISVGPMIIWLLFNAITHGDAANRTFSIRKIYFSKILQGFHTFADWVMPLEMPGFIKDIFVIVLIPLIFYVLFRVLMVRKEDADVQESVLSRGLCLFVFSYAAVVLAAVVLMTSSTPLDGRILAPVFVALLMLVPWGVKRFLQVEPDVLFRRLFVVLGVAVFCFYVFQFVVILKTPQHPDSFYHPAWRQSSFKAFIEGLPSGVPVYSNASDGIYFLTGRPTRHLPRKEFDAEGRPNPSMADDVRDMQKDVIEHSGYIVFFEKMKWRSYLIDESMLNKDTLNVYESTEEGIVYASAQR